MKKAFLVTILLFVFAGAFRSHAQIYSANAVGYVNVTLTPGFNMVVNPLDAGPGNNTISYLFQHMTPKIPNWTRIYYFNESGGFDTVVFNAFQNAWVPQSIAAKEIPPGKGAYLLLPGNESVTLTFVGEVKQGVLRNELPPGYSIIGNQVPRPGFPPGNPGDRVYKLNKSTGEYDVYSCSETTLKWFPVPPNIQVGEAVFYFRAGETRSWDQTFSIIQPSSLVLF